MVSITGAWSLQYKELEAPELLPASGTRYRPGHPSPLLAGPGSAAANPGARHTALESALAFPRGQGKRLYTDQTLVTVQLRGHSSTLKYLHTHTAAKRDDQS